MLEGSLTKKLAAHNRHKEDCEVPIRGAIRFFKKFYLFHTALPLS